MMISTICIIAAMAMNMLLAASNYRTIRGYIIFDRIDIHCEVQAVPFAQLSQMQPGEPNPPNPFSILGSAICLLSN